MTVKIALLTVLYFTLLAARRWQQLVHPQVLKQETQPVTY